jgi:hypothetical protein
MQQKGTENMRNIIDQSPCHATRNRLFHSGLRGGLFCTLVGAILSVVPALADGTTYVGNPLNFNPAGYGPDGLAPLVILGEYAPPGPLPAASPATTLPTGVVQDVVFYGQEWQFMLFALRLVETDDVDDTQTFQVVAYQRCHGNNPIPGLVTNAVTNFCVESGDLLAFAGIGPWYPQSPNDAPNSDATYEDANNSGSFIATRPLLGQEITMGINGVSPFPPVNATYGYIVDVFGNQGRTYAIGVDVAINAQCSGCFNIEPPCDIVEHTCGDSAPASFQVGAYDACCTNWTVTSSTSSGTVSSGSVFPVGTTTVTNTVTDTCDDGSYSDTFTVTVIQDNTPPVINCNPLLLVDCLYGLPYGLMPDETQNPLYIAGNTGAVTVTQSIPPCTQVYSGMMVTFTASNPCGGTATCTSEILLVQDPILTNPNPGSSNGFTGVVINWTLPNGQLQQSTDLVHWASIPGATNSPYVATNAATAGYYRLIFSY